MAQKYRSNGDYTRAAKLLSGLIPKFPQIIQLKYQLIEIYCELGETDKAN